MKTLKYFLINSVILSIMLIPLGAMKRNGDHMVGPNEKKQRCDDHPGLPYFSEASITSFHNAARIGHIGILDTYFKNFANASLYWDLLFSSSPRYHNTALHLAVMHRKIEAVKRLIQAAGFNAHMFARMKNADDKTALMLAQEDGYHEIVQVLIPYQ